MNTHTPLHAMIRSVINGATEKLAAEAGDGKEKKVKNLLKFEKQEHGHIPSVEEEKAEYPEKTASSFLDSDFIEKLASAVDYIAEHVGEIEQPGVLAQALAKVAGEGSPRGAGKGPGALEVSKAIGG